MIATAWLTFHWVQWRLVYGKASIEFFAVALRISSARIGARRQACGFAAAMSLKEL